MNTIVCLVVCSLVGMVLAQSPSAPQIPDVFYSKVSVGLKMGNDYWRGGGIYAFDVPEGRSRTDVNLVGQSGNKYIHILDRYDLNISYIISERSCEKKPVTGSLQSPWDWVSSATFAGNNTFQGNELFEWTYSPDSSVTLKIAVRADDNTKPVYFSSHIVNDSYVEQWDMLFLEFDAATPEDWVWTVPEMCDNPSGLMVGGTPSGVVYFANSQWDCVDVSCSSRVPAGSGQPGYECAEFTARSLAYGGYIPIAWNAAQSSYGNWKGYNLLLTTGLADALGSLGFKKMAPSGSSINAASALFGNGGNGYFSHACVGVGSNSVDCHNNARYNLPATSIMYLGIDAVYSP